MSNDREIPPSIDQLRLLRCIEAVASAGSTRQASEVLHVSQSSVTRAIQKFERRQRVRLFERAARGMVPTAIGGRVAVRAAALFEYLQAGALAVAADGPSGLIPTLLSVQVCAHTVFCDFLMQ